MTEGFGHEFFYCGLCRIHVGLVVSIDELDLFAGHLRVEFMCKLNAYPLLIALLPVLTG